jgi:hypothetical protein
MSYEWRLVVVVLAAFAAANLIASLVVARAWHRLLREAPVARASSLLTARLLPVAASAIAVILVGAGYLLFERRGEEATGLLLPGLAALGAALLGTAGVRVWRVNRTTRRAVDAWMATATPIALDGAGLPTYAIDTAFPVVAVVGVLRPRLLVARQVLASCPPDELRAIVAHEQSHLARRDNFRRALLATAPDALSWLPASRHIHEAWHDASEEAADDAASRDDAQTRIALAQALIRVARLAPVGAAVQPLPASALYRGENLDRRIRRLLVPPVPSGSWRSRWPIITATALTIVGLVRLDGVHWVVEAAVTYLP